jgi:hypothetical protein
MNLAPVLHFVSGNCTVRPGGDVSSMQDYPITKPFPRNWCHGLLAFGILSTAAFAAVNVFLVGEGDVDLGVLTS